MYEFFTDFGIFYFFKLFNLVSFLVIFVLNVILFFWNCKIEKYKIEKYNRTYILWRVIRLLDLAFGNALWFKGK